MKFTDKILYDIGAKKTCFYSAPEEFFRNFYSKSYIQLSIHTRYYKVFSYNNTCFKNETDYQKIKWHFTNLNSILNQIKLVIQINKTNYSVVWIHGFVSPLNILILKYFLRRQIKIIVQHHAEKPYENFLKLFIQKLAYKNLSGYLFTSKELATQYITNGIIKHDAKIYEIMEGSNLFETRDKLVSRKKLKIDDGEIFVWVGRLNENKDPLTILKAFKVYKEKGFLFKLYMIYSTNELELRIKEYINNNNLIESINLIGKTDHNEMEDWYNAADYFVLGSHYEGSGYALCEAMACGCIPIVTSIPSFKKMTNNGDCGLLFEPGNSNELQRKLESLSSINKNVLREKVLDQFKSELSFEAIAKKQKQMIEKV